MNIGAYHGSHTKILLAFVKQGWYNLVTCKSLGSSSSLGAAKWPETVQFPAIFLTGLVSVDLIARIAPGFAGWL